MSLNENAGLDPSQVEDLRGQRGGGRFGFPSGRGGGMRIPIPTGKGGIGLIGLAVFILLGLFAGGNATGLLPGLGGEGTGTEGESLGEACSRENPDRFDDVA